MVYFTMDDVNIAVANALTHDKPDRYVRLRDAARSETEATGNSEFYERFVAYSNEAVMAFTIVCADLFASLGLPTWRDWEKYKKLVKRLQKYMIEWTTDETLDDVLKELINDQIHEK